MKSKISLEDVEFLMIIRVDSEERVINLMLSLDFIAKYFRTIIAVLEVGPQKLLNIEQNESLKYEFIQDDIEVFHMTKYRNYLAKKSSASIIIHYDVDVITAPDDIFKIVANIRSQKISFGYPFDGRFLNVASIFKKSYFQVRDIQFLKNFQTCFQVIMVGSVGGIFICNREYYKEMGMENEDIIGWGPDDKQRFYKAIRSGGRFERTLSPIYHFSHPVLKNSRPINKGQLLKNFEAYLNSIS